MVIIISNSVTSRAIINEIRQPIKQKKIDFSFTFKTGFHPQTLKTDKSDYLVTAAFLENRPWIFCCSTLAFPTAMDLRRCPESRRHPNPVLKYLSSRTWAIRPGPKPPSPKGIWDYIVKPTAIKETRASLDNARKLFNMLETAFVTSGSEATLYTMHLPGEVRIQVTRASI